MHLCVRTTLSACVLQMSKTLAAQRARRNCRASLMQSCWRGFCRASRMLLKQRAIALYTVSVAPPRRDAHLLRHLCAPARADEWTVHACARSLEIDAYKRSAVLLVPHTQA